MPVGFDQALLRTEFATRWESPRIRAQAALEEIQTAGTAAPSTRSRSSKVSCPHNMTVVRSSRQLAKDKTQCVICLEVFFDTLIGRQRVVPVKVGCQHVFCRECIETHLSSNIRCPLPWCAAQLPLQPDNCDLCAYYEKSHADCLVVTVRANEMKSSIKADLDQLAVDSNFFKLPKVSNDRLMSYVWDTLKQYEWQYHAGIDLAELLDPFLRVLDRDAARAYYGATLHDPAPDPDIFPPRKNGPDDYPAGQEPWIAAFLREWALQYEKENGEVKEGWGVWAKKTRGQADHSWEWEWPYKRIIAHKTAPDGKIRYLLKWVGKRYPASWVGREQLAYDSNEIYDKEHGVLHPEDH